MSMMEPTGTTNPLTGALAQDRVADLRDVEHGHSRIGIRTPRSSATSTARS